MAFPINDVNDLETVIPLPSKKFDGFYSIPSYKKYIISKLGIIINENNGKVYKTYIGPTGYMTANLYINGKTLSKKVHRLLAITFIGRPTRHLNKSYDLLQVNHIDCNKLNNDLENLEWVTPKENVKHSRLNERNSDQTAILAKNLINGKVIRFKGLRECARNFNINKSSLYKYLNKTKNRARYHKDFYVFKYESDVRDFKHNSLKDMVEFGINKGVMYKNIYAFEIEGRHLYIFEDLKKCSKYLGYSYIKIWKKIRKNNLFNDNKLIIGFRNDVLNYCKAQKFIKSQADEIGRRKQLRP